MELRDLDELRHAAAAVATRNGDALDRLVWTAVFGASPDLKDAARQALFDAARSAGLYPASIHALYLARGRGEAPHGFTVPAVNVRGLAYDTARALMRARKRLEVGAVILEIARSEMTYTDQRPTEYTAVMLAAALREGLTGPVFVQGDHFQVNAKKYAAGPEAELEAVRTITAQAIAAGFYNIDVDTSTLVDLSKPDHEAQQEVNGTLCAQLTAFIRTHEPKGVTVSVGGEIGEVGGKNSTPEELHAFMKVYRRALEKAAPGKPGISKISIQVGTSHGGVVLPDGKIAQVKLDFDTLDQLSQLARTRYGMAGAVQHGASTLPAELFDKFPQRGACEIHLATEFQNMLYDHPDFPADLRQAIYERLRTAAADERKAGDTDEQFFYKTRKRALGLFKRELWALPAGVRASIGAALEAKFASLFEKLRVGGTQALVQRWAPPVPGVYPVAGAVVGAGSGPDDVSGLAD
jgi:fructose/tagatose bisphosphate aldolase